MTNLSLYELSGSKLASISSNKMKGVPNAEFSANIRASDAIVFSPPDNYSLVSNTYFLFGGVVVYITPALNGSCWFSRYSKALPPSFVESCSVSDRYNELISSLTL
jgi:adenine-specific DNA methylase